MIYIVHSGKLSEQIFAVLSSERVTVAWMPAHVDGAAQDWIVIASDNIRLDEIRRWASAASQKGMNLFPVHVQGSEAVIGPDVRPGRAGCLECWENRYFRGRPWLRRFMELAVECDDREPDPWLTEGVLTITSRIAARRVAQLAEANEAAREGQVYYLDIKTFRGAEWPLMRDHRCKFCGDAVDDSPERASIQLAGRSKRHTENDRLRPLSELRSLADTFTGHRSNIIERNSEQWWSTGGGGVVVSFGVALIQEAHPEPCSGFSICQSDARTAAILEGVERYSGVETRGFRSSTRGCFNELRDTAHDPRSFGLHSEREYQANAGLHRYSDDLEMYFVWAYSFREQRQVLVPLQIGFFSWPRPGDRLFVLGEGSSGCSIGSCLEEAIMHGLFELAERDAFMMSWIAKLTPPRVNLEDSTDPEIRHVIRKLNSAGFELSAFNITTDLGIPAIGLLACRENAWPFMMAGAAAHLRPERALKKALRELAGGLSLWELSGDRAAPRAAEMLENPKLVRKPMDHGLMYTAREARQFCDFMFASTERISMKDMAGPVSGFWSGDLGNDARGVIQWLNERGFEVIVVKHTGPEHESRGLHVAKVLVPGALPGTWGDHLWRTENLPRLDAALASSGSASPNLVPHPYA